MIPSTPFPTYNPFPSFVPQPTLQYPPFVFSNSISNSTATTSSRHVASPNVSGSSSNESPPPEPKVSDLKLLSNIAVPGTAEFDQRNESKYVTVGGMSLKLEKEEQKYVENKFPNTSPPTSAGTSQRRNM
ncbi:hypothetical protein KIN20_003995 [Parelaphostrongylus tenuis]|uniref:Uncharacterized protein n=1 Tax=Parelaphostrongylus tenuis TaxID=148309 RepID=A0AAD5LY50_PARTN|nr:hypothetical protein KIN20_003995 [Parelaphostrongylus tenuis]